MELDSYGFIIAASSVLIISFFFSVIARKTSLPSVLLLIFLGIFIKLGASFLGIEVIELFPILEVLGIIGLIMIVLEASLELELKKEKRKIIIQSFVMALLGLLIKAFAIAAIIQQFFQTDFFVALIYAIPLSIMSSAIVIPSVIHLPKEKKEFMVYESTLSDILGIMFFFFLIESVHADGATEIGVSIVFNIVFTIVVSIVLSYLLIYLFQRLRSEVKLFLLIAVLIFLYSLGKMMHFSSLVIILVFGLILNNYEMFFRGKLAKYVNSEAIKGIYKDFHTITVESSFVVRTYFFVIFGMTIMLSSFVNLQVIVVAMVILLVIFLFRILLMRIIIGKEIFPMALIAPRGLITILLFFAIPEDYKVAEFRPGILMFIILISSAIMAFSLIWFKKKTIPVKADTGSLEILDTMEVEKNSGT
ncbi:MAG: cation:proton antiporter [Bacteroidales bacterium]|nr:cation:proton antiporter [Bacteroidales bacterium]MCF8458274.1 cation:proton antiporter [Bacteroidales bacterium]